MNIFSWRKRVGNVRVAGEEDRIQAEEVHSSSVVAGDNSF